MSEHRVERPQWTCGIDGQDWPCELARKQLTEIHRAEPEILTRLTAMLAMIAAVDLGISSPAFLYRRFVAWTLDSTTRCRVCDRRGHDVLPGLPPRVFPCAKLIGQENQEVTTGM